MQSCDCTLLHLQGSKLSTNSVIAFMLATTTTLANGQYYMYTVDVHDTTSAETTSLQNHKLQTVTTAAECEAVSCR
jgi:hypothetical protein